MEKLTNQSISNIMQSSTLLQHYLNKTQSLAEFTKIIRQYLEPELAKNCNVANMQNNTLILATTSAAWNHQLKFLIPDLIKKLRKLPQFNNLTKIKIIQELPIINKTTVKNQKTITLSTNNAQYLIETAKHLSNKNLAKALLNLAKIADNS